MRNSLSITINDVAEEAKVSVATVSRVINQNGPVSVDTAQRVREAIEKLGYVPNLSAQNLRKKESRVVLIMVPNITNPFYSNILSGICQMAKELGYSALINSDDTRVEKTLSTMIESKRVDGAILLTCSVGDNWLAKYADNFPMVQCAEAVDGLDVPYVSIDNYTAMCQLVELVHSMGHRRIAYVNINNEFLSTRQRKNGYLDSINSSDSLCVYDESYVVATEGYDFDSGKRAGEALLKLPVPPTAVICGSDMLALGVMARAKERGLKVPQELSVTGFDDVEYTRIFQPYLTTVAQPCYDMGVRSMLKLKECIDNGSSTMNHIMLPYEIRIRESCSAVST